MPETILPSCFSTEEELCECNKMLFDFITVKFKRLNMRLDQVDANVLDSYNHFCLYAKICNDIDGACESFFQKIESLNLKESKENMQAQLNDLVKQYHEINAKIIALESAICPIDFDHRLMPGNLREKRFLNLIDEFNDLSRIKHNEYCAYFANYAAASAMFEFEALIDETIKYRQSLHLDPNQPDDVMADLNIVKNVTHKFNGIIDQTKLYADRNLHNAIYENMPNWTSSCLNCVYACDEMNLPELHLVDAPNPLVNDKIKMPDACLYPS